MNEHKAKQEALQRAQREFLQALSAGQAFPVDRFGAEITVGAKVLYQPPVDLVFEVLGITPLLDPRAQPGMMHVTLSVTFQMTAMARQITPNVIALPQLGMQQPPTTAPSPEAAPPALSGPVLVPPPPSEASDMPPDTHAPLEESSYALEAPDAAPASADEQPVAAAADPIDLSER